MPKIILSRKKADEIVSEINELNRIRPEIVAQLEAAVQLGDLSENAEYIEAKKKLAENDIKCNKLNNILNIATISDENITKKNYVDIFAKVVIKDMNDNTTFEYTLVSEEEASIFDNKISITSPLGSALNRRRVNDIVKIDAPRGVIEYQIIEINY